MSTTRPKDRSFRFRWVNCEQLASRPFPRVLRGEFYGTGPEARVIFKKGDQIGAFPVLIQSRGASGFPFVRSTEQEHLKLPASSWCSANISRELADVWMTGNGTSEMAEGDNTDGKGISFSPRFQGFNKVEEENKIKKKLIAIEHRIFEGCSMPVS